MAGLSSDYVDVATRCASGRDCVAVEAVASPSCRLCRGCVTRAESEIQDLRSDYAQLCALACEPGKSVDAPRVSGGAVEAPVPLSLPLEALARDVVWALTAWEDPIREAAGLPPVPAVGVRDRAAVARSTRVLAGRVPLLAELDASSGFFDGLAAGIVERDGLYAIEQFRRLHRLAQRAIGVAPRVQHLPGSCAECGARALTRVDGTEVVRCGGCGDRSPLDAYRDRIGLILRIRSLQ